MELKCLNKISTQKKILQIEVPLIKLGSQLNITS